MKMSKSKREELDVLLTKVRMHDQGKGPMPKLSAEELKEVRRFQARKLES